MLALQLELGQLALELELELELELASVVLVLELALALALELELGQLQSRWNYPWLIRLWRRIHTWLHFPLPRHRLRFPVQRPLERCDSPILLKRGTEWREARRA